MTAAKSAVKSTLKEMTVGGFIAYISKFDNDALILFKDVHVDLPFSTRCRKPTQFTEHLIKDGAETQLIVGLI